MGVRGMRDFSPEEEILRRKMIEKIESTFREFGFYPLDTPALEPGNVLLEKGEWVRDEIYMFKDKGGREVGLRFDLTVPLSRFLRERKVALPFRRYAIGKVWRYDRPQSGRFREFTQADVDIVGSKSILADVDCVLAGTEALKKIGAPHFKLVINNRVILNEICEKLNVRNSSKFMRIIDKWNKIGEEGVREEMEKNGLREEFEAFLEFVEKDVSEFENDEILRFMELVEDYVDVEFDIRLVRGLDYYTGIIFETFLKNRPEISVASGGRYDGMINGLPATGYSIGVDRLFDVAFKGRKGKKTYTQVFVCPVNKEYLKKALNVAMILRRERIPSEFDVMERKLSKQLDYARKMGIPFVAIIGDEGISLKDMETGEQKNVSVKELVEKIKKH